MEASTAPRTWADATEVLRSTLPNYEERPQQTRLAEAIEAAFDDGTPLIGQAGTGTGKSLAGLIPMILSGRPSYYSTGTKALQAQIMDKDLPFLREHLGINFRYAMLQGRSNYVCHARLLENVGDPDTTAVREAVSADDEANPMNFEITVRETLPFEVDDRTWRKVSISSDDCLRKDCPFYDNGCRAQYSKTLADTAHVVVVNHALVATDAKLYADTGGEVSLLGAIDNMVIDEAHELESYVVNALEAKITLGTFRALAGFLRTSARTLEMDDIDAELTEMLTAAEVLWEALPDDGRIRHARIIELIDTIQPLIESVRSLAALFGNVIADMLTSREQSLALIRSIRRLTNLHGKLEDFVLRRDSEVVRYVKVEDGHKILFVTPIEVGEWMATNMWTRYTPVLMSATCLVAGEADFIAKATGVDNPTVIDVGSPFDFRTNSRLYVPSTIPNPSGATREAWAAAMYPQMARMINASQGRALLLFTSRSQMRDAFFTLRRMIDFPCKMQGDESNPRLTRWLRETGGVLFGTKSFFTGIDIQGDNLSLVIIDKLPFPVPTDPMVEAKTELCEQRGGNPFSELTIPEMTLPLMQAFGRLIRTMTDRGVVAIMDPRITGKGYGRKVSRSIPAPLTIDIGEVERFFAAGVVA
jgi:ATP-dependent DNA helicase DinG